MMELSNEEFAERFKDIRHHTPEPGQVIARYRAKAELIEGYEKQNLMDLLFMADKALPAVQVMSSIFCAIEEDAVRVPLEIAEDLQKMPYAEVLAKPYPYTIELLYYTHPEYIPTNDPHWSSVSVLNLDEFCTTEDGIQIKSKILEKKDGLQEDQAIKPGEDTDDLYSA